MKGDAPALALSRRKFLSSCVLVAVAVGCNSNAPGDHVSLPNGSVGIGFDDLRYSTALHRVVVPAGRTGTLYLVDPAMLTVAGVGGFRSTSDFSGGHDDGPTSVDEGFGFLFVTDRTSGSVSVVDPGGLDIVGTAQLASRPDYVRFVAPTGELWVTEPNQQQIEILSLGDSRPPMPTPVGSIAIDNGPESLVIDATRGKAYTHRWQASTVEVDLASRAITAVWPNGCASSRGIALDERRGLLFIACLEGTTSVLDVDHGGKIISTVAQGSGFDVIGYNPALAHLYLAGSACQCLVTLGVAADGALSFLGRLDAPPDAHCATYDDIGHAWVCAPDTGEVIRIADPYPPSSP
jgi:DNA-binding beta-propeller fold protein YncE